MAVTVAALVALPDAANGGSIGDFFKRLGHSIAPGQNKKSKPRDAKSASKRARTKGTVAQADHPPEPTAAPTLEPTATATVQQTPVRVASLPTQAKTSKRDIPYAIPVPNKPGFVTSPYAPKQGLVDVRGFASGTEVVDPYTGKVFLTP